VYNCYMMTEEGIQYIKIFSSLSGVRVVFLNVAVLKYSLHKKRHYTETTN